MTFDRETATTDALLTDLYLDALLAGAVLDAAAADGATATPGRGPRLDPAARDAADRLRRDLVRVHPSFRFEERLATRLAEAAVAMRLPVAAGAEGRVVPFRPGGPAAEQPLETSASGDLADRSAIDPLVPDATSGDPARRPAPRPLLIGGALTSAAISIAGAAWVAWRLGRPSRGSSPMVRAARAVRESRTIGPGTVTLAIEPGLKGAGRAVRTARRSTRRRLD
jgi:hypothetical protein